MNLKVYVISRREVGPGVPAAGFFPPQRSPGHQPADRDDGGQPPVGGCESSGDDAWRNSRVPRVELADCGFQ